MPLLNDRLRQQLLDNGRRQAEVRGGRGGLDFEPVVKLFTPSGGATWLLTELDPEDPHLAFGLCDLGLGFPELGAVDLEELERVRGPFGFGVEVDLYFRATKPLRAYAHEARQLGRIRA